MKGRAPGGKVKGGGGKGGNASLPGDSRVSRRFRPLALLIFKNFIYSYSLPPCLLCLFETVAFLSSKINPRRNRACAGPHQGAAASLPYGCTPSPRDRPEMCGVPISCVWATCGKWEDDVMCAWHVRGERFAVGRCNSFALCYTLLSPIRLRLTKAAGPLASRTAAVPPTRNADKCRMELAEAYKTWDEAPPSDGHVPTVRTSKPSDGHVPTVRRTRPHYPKDTSPLSEGHVPTVRRTSPHRPKDTSLLPAAPHVVLFLWFRPVPHPPRRLPVAAVVVGAGRGRRRPLGCASECLGQAEHARDGLYFAQSLFELLDRIANFP
eukprot:scaffold8997_cov116-Isochrysis_galbana.AAC.1